jgi:hypothetical protein
MTANEIQLQITKFSRLDADIGELSETGIDAVNRVTLGNDLLHDTSGCIATRARRSGKHYVLSTCGDVGDLLERQSLAAKL